MPTKKRTQKQKQKQKQTVIVNINEKPKPRRKRTTKKAPPTKRTGESSHIPLNAVRDILFQLSRGTHTPDAITARVMATRTQDPQAEIIRDVRDENRIPNRPPTSLTPIDTASGILRGNTPQPSPFVSSITQHSPSIFDVAEEYNTYTQLPTDDQRLVDEYILGGNTPPPPSIFATTEEYGTYTKLPTDDRHLVDEYVLGGNAPPPSPFVEPTMNQPPPTTHIADEEEYETYTKIPTDDQHLIDEYVLGGNATQPSSIFDTGLGILGGNTPTPPSPFADSTTKKNTEPPPPSPFVDPIPETNTEPTTNQPLPVDTILGGNIPPLPSPFVDSTTETNTEPPTIHPDEEVAKDAQYIGDYQDTLAKTELPARYTTFEEALSQQQLKKVEGRFASSDVPEAFFTPAVLQANSIKMNLKTNEELALAGFSGAKELRTAINTWNIGQPAPLQINTTFKSGGYKKNDVLIAEIKSKHMTLSEIKAYHDDHTLVSPHKVKDRQGKK